MFNYTKAGEESMLKNKYLPFALLALSQGVFAVEPPSAGSQIQQIPPTQLPQKEVPKVEFRQPASPTIQGSDNVKIIVKQLKITGAQAYSEAELLAVTGFQPGSELNLSDLRGMASRIANYYHSNGFFVAQAYLPAQDIKDGVITIAVIDGKYGKITVRNQTNLSDRQANRILGGLNSGDIIESSSLESRLLLLSDFPGVKVKSTLVPGASVGASDLIVDVTPGQRITGSIDADNAGNYYTGRNRIGATVNLNNPAGQGDVASVRVLTSGEGMNYARASYQMQFGKATAGVAYSHLEYKLGHNFAPLPQYDGTADIASIYGSYPLIRSRNTNLYAGLAFDAKKFRDNWEPNPDKKSQVLMASLYGNHRDYIGGGGVSAYSATFHAGRLDLETPGVSTEHFNKVTFSASRLQRVTDTISLSATINGQVASKNLDSSEKMELGGMYAVRAYPEGEAFADQGYVLNLEARMQLPKLYDHMPGQLTLIGFVDTGSVMLNKDFVGTGENHRTLSGAGVGLNWSEPNNYMVRAYYAHRLGNEKATSSPDSSGRFWIQGVKYFGAF